MIAAVAAWEVKLPVAAVEAQARQKLSELNEIRSVVEADEALMKSCGVWPLNRLMALPDLSSEPAANAQARELLSQLVVDPEERLLVTRRAGCTYCQAQRHGFQAYNPMVQRTAALYDVLLHGQMQSMVACDIKSPPSQVTSPMIQMAYDADPILKEAGVEIPLFW